MSTIQTRSFFLLCYSFPVIKEPLNRVHKKFSNSPGSGEGHTAWRFRLSMLSTQASVGWRSLGQGLDEELMPPVPRQGDNHGRGTLEKELWLYSRAWWRPEGAIAWVTHSPFVLHCSRPLGRAQVPHKQNKTNIILAQKFHHRTSPQGQSADIHWLIFDILFLDWILIK